MRAARVDIGERTISLSLRIIRLCRALRKDAIGQVLGKQLLRSGTSIGANVHEAQGGQSKADFIAKISITQKEALETGYWLHLIRESGTIKAERISELVDEVEQLKRILAKILVTSKSRTKATS